MKFVDDDDDDDDDSAAHRTLHCLLGKQQHYYYYKYRTRSTQLKKLANMGKCHRRSQGVQWVHLHPPRAVKNFFQA